MTDIDNYIKNARAKGYPDDKIKEALQQTGWPEEKIDEALADKKNSVHDLGRAD